jgi:hypothetical protein
MEVNTMEEGETSDVAGEEVVMEDMDHAKVEVRVIKPKKRIVREKGHELSSDEELRAQFSTVRNRKKPRKSSNSGVKQSSNKNQNVNRSQNHNQAKERIEQVECEAQSLGIEVANKSSKWYDQTGQNGRKDLGESFKSNKQKREK